MNINELNDEQLETIQGGSIDWDLFLIKFKEYVKTIDNFTLEHKELLQALLRQDMVEVKMHVINLATQDPNIILMLRECDIEV